MPLSPRQSPADSPAPTVLLVEDNEINRYTVARMLRQAGFEVLEAESGARAEELLLGPDGAPACDVILCDVELPDVDGFELCRRWKADPATASIPFLQISASFTSAQHQVQGLEGGADGYLVQPFEMPVLAATIRALLRLRAAEERARLLSRQWQSTFAAIRDPIVVSDGDGLISRCNAAFAGLMGARPEDLRSRTLSSLGVPSLDAMPHSAPAWGEDSSEVLIDERWFRIRRDPVPDERGESTRLIQVLDDITASKRAAAEREELIHSLEFERSRLETIFTDVPAFVAVMRGPEHRFELMNPEYLRFAGDRDLLGRTLREAFPDMADQGYYEIVDQVFQSGQPFEGREMRVLLQREPGAPPEERFINLLHHPLLEADGSISGVFTHGVDITEQVRARKQAEAANRLKDEFLATLSHELRTPLMSMLGWAQLLREGDLDKETTARAIDSIERNARAQSQLVEDILDVSRIMSGKLRLDVRQFDLAESIEGAVNAVRPAASAKGIRLDIGLDPAAGLIAGDANRLQQVMWNLLSNAIKFTPRGGQVRVSLDRDGSNAQVTVADSGEGIEKPFLPHVFDRFRQADSSSTRQHGGLGLGLAIVRHMVELHGGTIGVSSEGKGQGATFTARFPLAAVVAPDEDPAEVPGSEAAAPGSAASALDAGAAIVGRLAGVHVVAVDDEPDARILIAALLRRAGASVSSAATAAEGWALLEGAEGVARPDVLISDIGMPEQDGYALIERLRAAEKGSGAAPLPCVALTAFAQPSEQQRVLRAGFDVYVPKPVEPAELVAIVARLAGRPAST